MKRGLLYLFILLIASCVEPYDPPEIIDFPELLVVNANINASSKSGEVVLSKSQSLSSNEPVEYISNALIRLEHESGAVWNFDEVDNGKYRLENFEVNIGEKARLHIFLNDDNEIFSDYETLKATPEIDSISFESNEQGVQFYINTHDDQNQARYYKWEFEETWEFNPKYPAPYHVDIIDSVPVVSFNPRYDTMFICYRQTVSKEILLGTTEKLTNDVIAHYPIKYTGGETGKFTNRYSLLIKQQALQKSVYNYWKLLESNTENVGSIFDPQPYQIGSNLQNISDPSQKVIGYFNLYTETEKRIFVNSNEVPYYIYANEYSTCKLDTVLVEDIANKYQYNYFVAEVRSQTGPELLGYTVTTPYCADCRFLGTNKKPEFWDQ